MMNFTDVPNIRSAHDQIVDLMAGVEDEDSVFAILQKHQDRIPLLEPFSWGALRKISKLVNEVAVRRASRKVRQVEDALNPFSFPREERIDDPAQLQLGDRTT